MYNTQPDSVGKETTLASWGRLARAHTILATALIPIVVYVSTGDSRIYPALQLLAIVGFFHVSICSMNDYFDLEDDLNDPSKNIRPLVSGEISKKAGLAFAVSTMLIGLALSLVISLEFFIVAVAGFGVATLYNYQSGKKVYADVWYVFSILLVSLLGVVISNTYNNITTLLLIALGIHGFFQVQEGHMKDLKEDEANIIQWLGVEIRDNNYVHYPNMFIGTTYALKSLEFVLLVAIVYLSTDLISTYSTPAIAILAVTFAANVALFFWSLDEWLLEKYDRDDVIRNITFHEVSSVMLILLVVMPYSPVLVIGLMIFTPASLAISNALIHRDIVSPDI